MDKETNYAATFYSETDNNAKVLEKNVMDYPSSPVARFLLLYHYKKNNDPRFEELAKQTAIYFYNPLWAQYQLSQADESGNIYINKDPQSKPDNDLESPKKEDVLIENNDAANEINTDNNELLLPVNKQISTNLNLDSSTSEEGINQLSDKAQNEQNNVDVDIATVQDKNNYQPFTEIKEDTQEENVLSEELPVPANEPYRTVSKQINENFILTTEPVEERTKQVSVNRQIETISSAEGAFLLNTLTEETAQHSLHENNADNDYNSKLNAENNAVGDSNNEETQESSSINLQTQNAEITENGNEEQDVPFEPLHTVDYFASQGIKIPEEALENDNLGKQVKSFTAWLKSMKKLHPGQLPEQNEVIERIIQASSEASNQNAHVLTEAMAEVLVKQGKQEKAIEMYEKLSLLNPSKSAYFAAKIENLNTI